MHISSHSRGAEDGTLRDRRLSASTGLERLRRRSTPVRRVDWPLVADQAASRPRVSRVLEAEGEVAVLAMAEELASYSDADTVCRRSVELARDRLGLERTAIFLEEEGMMYGTWGTGPRGETTDEHEYAFPVGDYERTAHELALQGTQSWLLLENAPQIAHVAGETVLLGYGWLSLTPIRVAGRRIGVMFSDGALTQSGFSRPHQVGLALLCSLLGSILLGQKSAYDLVDSRTRPGEEVHPTVRRALELVDSDLTLSTDQVADLLGMSPRYLGSLFRQGMGESLVTYRNRRRLERFFVLADRRGDNILQAALAAGFGSNAQFHRVFRAMLGTTPAEYLGSKESEGSLAGLACQK